MKLINVAIFSFNFCQNLFTFTFVHASGGIDIDFLIQVNYDLVICVVN